MKLAPSAFSERPSEKMSNRYMFIPTTRVIDLLMADGWIPFFAAQSRVNCDGNAGFQKHMIRFRKDSEETQLMRVGGVVPELVLTNSHNGTSTFNLSLGILRLICTNGILVSSGRIQDYSIKHVGYSDNDVIDASYEIIRQIPGVEDTIGEMTETSLNHEERLLLAEQSIHMRWDGGTSPVAPEVVIKDRYGRRGDKESDVFTTYNVIQENLIRGGLDGRGASGRPRRTKRITSVNENIRINRALWALAEGMSAIKNGRGVPAHAQ